MTTQAVHTFAESLIKQTEGLTVGKRNFPSIKGPSVSSRGPQPKGGLPLVRGSSVGHKVIRWSEGSSVYLRGPRSVRWPSVGQKVSCWSEGPSVVLEKSFVGLKGP